MNIVIEDEHREILDAIIPQFEFNEVIDIRKSIRKAMDGHLLSQKNLPVGSIADALRDFLIRYSFAVNSSGEALINSRGIALKKANTLHGFQRMLQTPHDYMVIDDDDINNRICKSLINKVTPAADVHAFTDPNIALRHIHAGYGQEDMKDVIMLLDINMPTLFGWEVLDEFKSFSDITRNHFKIFMLTSSVNPKDKERAIGNPHLWGFIEKPLTIGKLETLLIDNNPFSKR